VSAAARAGSPRVGLGLKLSLLSLAMGLAAVNTGNNLIYLMLSMVLGLVACAALAGRWSMRSMRLTVHLPGEVRCGEPFAARVEVAGRFPLLPRAWVDVRIDGLPGPLEVSIPVSSRTGRGLGTATAVANRRGVFRDLTAVGRTGYPLELSHRRSRRIEAGTLVVLPGFRPIRGMRARGGRGGGHRADAPSPRPGGVGTDFHDLREYTQADDARHIDWRASARTSDLMVREFERETPSRRLDLALDTAAGDGQPFEDLVSRCAALLDCARREGMDARLLLPDAAGPLEPVEAMRALAEVAAAPRDRGETLSRCLARARRGAERIVLSLDASRATPLETVP